jgi:cobalamin biosynthesis Mg chelatase CobN
VTSIPRVRRTLPIALVLAALGAGSATAATGGASAPATDPSTPATTPTTTYVPPGAATTPGAATAPGVTATPGATPTTPGAATTPGTATAPTVSTPATTAPAGTSPQSATGVVKGKRTTSNGGLSAATIAIVALAALLVLACVAWALARGRAFEPHWLLSLRHAMAEAGFRASATWSEFADWVRLGR